MTIVKDTTPTIRAYKRIGRILESLSEVERARVIRSIVLIFDPIVDTVLSEGEVEAAERARALDGAQT